MCRIFGINAGLDRRSGMLDVLLLERQRLARGDPNLRLDEVDAGHQFGHGMFDLNSRVHFDEVELVFLLVENEFDRAGVGVTGLFDQPHRRLADLFADITGQRGARAFFDQFLVSPLKRAVALPEVHGVALGVGDNLDFDVPRALDVFFEVDAGILERLFGLERGRLQPRLQRDVVHGDAHALAPAAGGRLDQHWIANFVGDRQCLGFARDQAGYLLARDRVSQLFHRFMGRADELDVATAAYLGEVGIFGEEPVTGMNRLNVADFGGTDDAIDHQVAFTGGGCPDAIGLVGQFEVVSAAVGFTEDSHRLDAHFLTGSNDAQGDLASIRN